ncbi:Na+-dependent transporter [Mesorhizobium sp. B2-4-14]|uniref:bile acid:sodium symporter family protein n=1 Tax=Mesorhizobium sp. B2-4-14 TaxID=2589935 RepID=UPI00112EDE9C|nr:Na+-dependent transporter [Mesorhizobium sp. B2-4-14]TPL02538.1 Na+-dependent transporter [Mesorhizobium sp. B2-4-14]
MTIASVISLALTVSLFVLVFVLGLKAKMEEVTFLFRHPGLLVRSILAMNIILLAVVVLAGQLFDLAPAIKIALITLAVSPVPPLLPNKQIGAGGTSHYAVGLLAAAAIVSIVLVPLSIETMEYVFPFELSIAPSKVLSVVVLSIFAPLVLGMVVARLAPSVAARMARPLSSTAMAIVLLAIIPILIKGWPDLSNLFGNGVVLCLVLFSAIGILLGHLLGGPDPGNRTVLALACGSRHPGIALAITSLNFPAETGVTALILYHLVIGALVSALYLRWNKPAALSPSPT